MVPEDLKYIQTEALKSKEELLEIIVSLKKELAENKLFRIENEKSMTAMSIDYTRLETKVKELSAENKELKAALKNISDQNKLKTIDIFGCTSEKMAFVASGNEVIEEIDEAETEDILTNEMPEKVIKYPSSIKHVNKKSNGKRTRDLSKLPKEQKYILNIDKLNSEYGSGNWRIAYWHKHTSIEHKREELYALETYTPVISAGLEHTLKTIPYEDVLLSKSLISPSLMTSIYYDKFFLSLPLYRQEVKFENLGFRISRQDMSNWVIRFAYEYFSLIADFLKDELLKHSYHQCDETTLRVINDGRKAGSKSFMWVHITSELLNVNPIVLFCFELTRGTDHLRKFYEDFNGFITCDAYCSYKVLEKEKMDAITICGCMMHARRRFVQSLALLDKSNLSADKIKDLIEVKALTLISKIYDADEALKNLSSGERKKLRDEKVKPLVKEYYEYISGIDMSDPAIGSRLKDAITYSLNQKEYLCRFLEDGNIPLDDGETERKIKNFAVSRKNFLFCYSIDGAEAAGIMYSVIETAKANHANVYWYLRYVLETMPRYMNGTDRGFIKDMMPWSEKYRQYEQQHVSVSNVVETLPHEYADKPHTPSKITA